MIELVQNYYSIEYYKYPVNSRESQGTWNNQCPVKGKASNWVECPEWSWISQGENKLLL